ncbi:MAG: membrane protein insertase YidC [Clostridia bacterium]|nr:membrane protein insertase YidC [Clostridia bacterium]
MDFAYPFGLVLKGCHWLTNNYVFAILLFALAMQLLLCPFGVIQQKNMVKQAKMRPMEYIIRKKYAGRNDRATQQKMQNEIMELYQREGYSPFKGCLPMLIQLIIIFPIYNAVVNPLRYISALPKDVCSTIELCFQHFKDASGAGTGMPNSARQVWLSSNLPSMDYNKVSEIIKEVPNPKGGDPLVSGDSAVKALDALFDATADGKFEYAVDFANVPETLAENPYAAFAAFGALWFLLLIPVFNLGLTYLQQFVSKKLSYQDPNAQQAGGMMGSMKIMMLVMPLMTFFFTFTFPAAIGIYWIFRTLLAMLQQFILSRIFKLPKYTDEDLKRIEKEMKEAKNNAMPKRRSLFQMPTNDVLEERGIRSLHHIDDDDE